jgi:hypothetical protein
MEDLRQRALGTIIKNAVINIPSALIIGAGIVLVGLGVQIPVLGAAPFNVPPTAWLAGLVPLWLGVVGFNLFNKRAGEQAVSQLFREQFDMSRITNTNLRTQIAQAIAYRERIDQAVARFGDKSSRGRVQDVANQVQEWIRRIYSLAVKIDSFHNDTVIRNDLQTVPDSIRKLRQRLSVEGDTHIRAEITDTIARRQAQYENLSKLVGTMERAELQLENTLTALGTVYSQVLLVDAGDVNSSKTQRLRESIAEQVNGLQDLLTSMDEVYDRSQDQLGTAARNVASR